MVCFACVDGYRTVIVQVERTAQVTTSVGVCVTVDEGGSIVQCKVQVVVGSGGDVFHVQVDVGSDLARSSDTDDIEGGACYQVSRCGGRERRCIGDVVCTCRSNLCLRQHAHGQSVVIGVVDIERRHLGGSTGITNVVVCVLCPDIWSSWTCYTRCTSSTSRS